MSTYELPTLLQICKRYADLGSSVQEQLDAAAEGDGEEQNPHALALAVERFLMPLAMDHLDIQEAQEEARTLIEEIEHYGIDPNEFEPVQS